MGSPKLWDEIEKALGYIHPTSIQGKALAAVCDRREADYLALRAECDGLRAISDAATPGPWVVSERRVPWSLPERTYQVANFPVMTDPAKTGEHVERTIITGWDHPQAKGPIGIVCNSFCIGNEGGPGVHLVYMSAEDAAFIVACVNHIRAAIDAGREP